MTSMPATLDEQLAQIQQAVGLARRVRDLPPRPVWILAVPPCDGPLPARAIDCRLEHMQLDALSSDLESIPPASSWSVADVLEAGGPECRANLARVLGVEGDVRALAAALGRAGGHWVRNRLRGSGVSYDEIVRDVAKAEQILVSDSELTASVEERIVRKVFARLLEGMEVQERELVIARLQEEAAGRGRSFVVEATAGAALVAAKASGFGVYLMATTLLGATSKALGLGLGFGVYVGLTQALAVVMPAGLALLALWTAFKLGAPSMKRLVPAVLVVASARLELVDRLGAVVDGVRMRQARLREREIELGRVVDPTIALQGQSRRLWAWWLGAGIAITAAASAAMLWL